MEKVKSNFMVNLLKIIKSSLYAVAITLVGVVLLAVLLKFVDLSANMIEWGNNIIKTIALFFMMVSLRKFNDGKLFFKSIFAGLMYAVICFLIFSILNGQVVFNFNLIYDILFAVIVSLILTIVLNLFQRKGV